MSERNFGCLDYLSAFAEGTLGVIDAEGVVVSSVLFRFAQTSIQKKLNCEEEALLISTQACSYGSQTGIRVGDGRICSLLAPMRILG